MSGLDIWLCYQYEGIIFRFNDATRTTWDRVSTKLIEAAEGLEAL